MTRDEILKLEASPQMNALIAVKLMGFRIVSNSAFPETNYYSKDAKNAFLIGQLPHYSSDIAAAWEVVEEIPKIAIRKGILAEWIIEWPDNKNKYGTNFVHARTAPLAICRAALLLEAE